MLANFPKAAAGALATDGNFVDNFFGAAPLAYSSSILFSGNYYAEGSTLATWVPEVGNVLGAYSAYSLINDNKETIRRRYNRNNNLYNTTIGYFATGFYF